MDRLVGKYRGIVTANVDPSGMHRVRVRVPDVSGDAESGWAVLSLPIGVAVSRIQPPNIGDPVWVEFEGGSPDHPICVGKIPAA